MKILAACHAHSKWSYDGSWTLAAMAEEFSRRGYQALLMTEHDRGFNSEKLAAFREECRSVSSEKIVVIPGIEYSDKSNTIHILTWGNVPFLGENRPTSETLRLVKEAGGVSVLAHPSRRSAWRLYDNAWTDDLLGIEIWNRKTDGWCPSRHAAGLLTSSRKLPFAGLDFHSEKELFPLAMSLELDSHPSETSVLTALKSRNASPHAFGKALTATRSALYSFSLQPLEINRRAVRWLRRRTTFLQKKLGAAPQIQIL